MSNSKVFNFVTTGRIPEVEQIRQAFARKHELEKVICKLIKDYELETGLRIDMIKYQRDITLPMKDSLYTDLSIIITAEE